MVVDSTECIKNHAIPRDRTKPLYLAAHSIANSNTPANRKIKLDSLRASLAAMFLCTETFKSVEALLKRTQSFPFLATDYVLDFFHHSDTLQPKLAVSTPRTTGSSALKLFSQVLPSSGDSLFGPTNSPCFKSFTSRHVFFARLNPLRAFAPNPKRTHSDTTQDHDEQPVEPPPSKQVHRNHSEDNLPLEETPLPIEDIPMSPEPHTATSVPWQMDFRFPAELGDMTEVYDFIRQRAKPFERICSIFQSKQSNLSYNGFVNKVRLRSSPVLNRLFKAFKYLESKDLMPHFGLEPTRIATPPNTGSPATPTPRGFSTALQITPSSALTQTPLTAGSATSRTVTSLLSPLQFPLSGSQSELLTVAHRPLLAEHRCEYPPLMDTSKLQRLINDFRDWVYSTRARLADCATDNKSFCEKQIQDFMTLERHYLASRYLKELSQKLFLPFTDSKQHIPSSGPNPLCHPSAGTTARAIFGLQDISCPSDGNCFFHACRISAGNITDSSLLRTCTILYAMINFSIFKPTMFVDLISRGLLDFDIQRHHFGYVFSTPVRLFLSASNHLWQVRGSHNCSLCFCLSGSTSLHLRNAG